MGLKAMLTKDCGCGVAVNATRRTVSGGRDAGSATRKTKMKFDDGDRMRNAYVEGAKITSAMIRYVGGAKILMLWHCPHCGTRNSGKNHERCWYCGRSKASVESGAT